MIAPRAHIWDRLTMRPADRGSLWPWWMLRIWPLILSLPTIVLGAWVILVWKFNGLYGQDPFAYYDYAVGSLRHSLLAGTPLTAMFWPLGYPILVTLLSLLVGPITAAGQIVNFVADASAVCLTYLLGRDVLLLAGADSRTARRAGTIGALLLGVTGRLLESSVLIMADSVALATALLSAWALVRWSEAVEEDRPARMPQVGWLVVAGAGLAWSVVTRWGQAVLVAAWLAWIVPTLWARWSRLWRALPWAIVPAAAVVGAQLFLVFTVRPVADLGKLPFAGDLALLNGSGNGWSLVNLLHHRFVSADGVQQYPWSNGLFYATGAFRTEYLTTLFLPATLLGLAVAAVSYRRSLLLLVTWPAILLSFYAGLDEQNPRFILAALPPIAILAGLGVAVLWDRLRPRWYPVAAMLVAAGLLVVALNGLSQVSTLNRERNGDLQVAAWTSARVATRATLVSFGITLMLQHTTDLRVLDLSVLSRHDLTRLLALRRPLYVLVPTKAMYHQFAHRPPGINYRFLRSSPGAAQIGQLRGYSLLRVGSS